MRSRFVSGLGFGLLVAALMVAALGAGLNVQKTYTVRAGYKPAGPPVVLSSLSAVSRLTTVPTGANVAWIQCETQNVRWLDYHFDGTLSTRTSNTAGIVTCATTDGVAAASHGIAAANTLDVWWNGGARTGMTISDVTNAVITVTGGAGDNFPVVDTVVEIGAQPTATFGCLLYAGDFMPEFDGDLEKLRFIETAASASVTIQPYRP